MDSSVSMSMSLCVVFTLNDVSSRYARVYPTVAGQDKNSAVSLFPVDGLNGRTLTLWELSLVVAVGYRHS